MNKNKIVILLSIFIIIIIGCDNTMNTPANKVESFIEKYQRLDKEVIDSLNNIINKDSVMNKKEKKEYLALIQKQYQNLSYKIKGEQIENNVATVEVEIEVLDYKNAINRAKETYQQEKEESLMEKRIKEMKKVSNKVKYDLTIHLKNENGIWSIEELTEEDRKKIHGLY